MPDGACLTRLVDIVIGFVCTEAVSVEVDEGVKKISSKVKEFRVNELSRRPTYGCCPGDPDVPVQTSSLG